MVSRYGRPLAYDVCVIWRGACTVYCVHADIDEATEDRPVDAAALAVSTDCSHGALLWQQSYGNAGPVTRHVTLYKADKLIARDNHYIYLIYQSTA